MSVAEIQGLIMMLLILLMGIGFLIYYTIQDRKAKNREQVVR